MRSNVDFLILVIIVILFLSSQVQIDSFSGSGRDEEDPMSSSPPLPPQIVQHSILDTEIEDFGSLSGARMELDRASDLLVSVSVGTEENKQKIVDLSSAALKELLKMAKEKQPLWRDCIDGEVLNHIEYTKQFGQIDKTAEKIMRKTEETLLSPNLGSPRHISALPEESRITLNTEASRHTQFLPVDPVHIVELLMDMVSFSLSINNRRFYCYAGIEE